MERNAGSRKQRIIKAPGEPGLFYEIEVGTEPFSASRTPPPLAPAVRLPGFFAVQLPDISILFSIFQWMIAILSPAERLKTVYNKRDVNNR
jgi:hypothetical protein